MRTVVYESEFDDELEEIEPEFERADEFIRGTEWVLSRDPESGTCVDHVR